MKIVTRKLNTQMPETRIIGMGTINLILQVEAELLAVRSLNNIMAKRRPYDGKYSKL